MPVSRLLVRPDAGPLRPLAAADRIGLSVLDPDEARLRGYATSGLGLDLGPVVPEPDPVAGPTATPPAAHADAPADAEDALAVVANELTGEGRATVVGPIGPVRAARWKAQLPVSAAGASPEAGDANGSGAAASSPNAEATSS